MNLDKPISPRHFEVSHDIGAAPRQQELPQPMPGAEPARLLQRLERAEHRLDLIDGALAMLAESLNNGGRA